MSRRGNDDKQLRKAIEIGNNNRKIIPLVKNWCKHIVITDRSAGMIAEMYRLPMQQEISCPHTTKRNAALNFEWIAHDFIIANCINCKFHEEVFPNNYGRPVLEEYQQQIKEQEEYKIEELDRKEKLKKEITVAAQNDASSSLITTLSILNLVQQLDNIEDQINTSEKIFEAAKLSPQYFSSVAIDYIALYFEEECGGILLDTVCEIKERQNIILSVFCFKRVLSALSHHINFDKAVRLFNLKLTDNEIDSYEEHYRIIISNCNYENSYRFADEKAGSYPNSIILFQRIFKNNKVVFDAIISEELHIDDKTNRINIDRFLLDFCDVNIAAVERFLESIIKSFEFEDDGYGESADGATRKLVARLYDNNPNKMLATLDDIFPRLSCDAQTEIIKLYEKLLIYDKFSLKLDGIRIAINQKLINLLLDTKIESKIRETLLFSIRQVSNKHPRELIDHYDTLFGFLIKLNEEFRKFQWQKSEIENTERLPSTFNSLVGKNFWEIDIIRLGLNRAISETKDILRNILESDINRLLPSFLNTIKNIDSKPDGELKANLIDILRGAVNETLTIGDMLPHIYTYIYDHDSEYVRSSGMKYVIHIIDKHPQIVTQTFIDTIKIFFDDPSVLIKCRAIEAFGSIIKRFPKQVDTGSIKRILDFMKNSRVLIHKNATKLSYSLYPFLDENNFSILFYNLINLEYVYYNDKDFDFCEDLIRILLYITKDNEKTYHGIIKTLIPKYCNSKDYYTDEKFISILTEIVSTLPKFYDIWITETLGFLTRTEPDYSSGPDIRQKLFRQFYHVDTLVFKSSLPQFVDFVRVRIDNSIFADVVNSYAILAYFGCFKEMVDLTTYFRKSVPENISLQQINLLNSKVNRIAITEFKAADGSLDEGWLKAIDDDN